MLWIVFKRSVESEDTVNEEILGPWDGRFREKGRHAAKIHVFGRNNF